MRSLFSSILLLLFGLQNLAVSAVKPVSNVEDLRAILATAGEGEVIELAAGEYQLTESLVVRGGVSLRGAGAGKTIIRPAPTWVPSTQSLPDPEVKIKGLDSSAYLIRLEDKAENIAISHLTLEGPAVHGAIFGFGNQQVELHHLHIENVLYCGIRSLGWKQANIHDCEFVDAGGKWKRGGVPGVDGGICGGAIFVTWISDSEIWNNRISRTIEGKERSHFGIKGRQGKRCKIHHNTINVNFSIEFPFEGDQDMEIHHNVLHGVVSIPKYAGGKVPESGRTFHIHHNYFTTSYAIEFVRNGVEIHHNLFDFDPEKDGGNLISAFGKAPAPGPASFHNNLVSNPGRGVIWMNEPFDHLTVRNNHIVTRTTATPRKEGLFGLNEKTDFSTVQISDNIIECIGQQRPLLRRDAQYTAKIYNNHLTNISDAEKLDNPKTDSIAGLEAPLKFKCGVKGEMLVDGWEAVAYQ